MFKWLFHRVVLPLPCLLLTTHNTLSRSLSPRRRRKKYIHVPNWARNHMNMLCYLRAQRAFFSMSIKLSPLKHLAAISPIRQWVFFSFAWAVFFFVHFASCFAVHEHSSDSFAAYDDNDWEGGTISSYLICWAMAAWAYMVRTLRTTSNVSAFNFWIFAWKMAPAGVKL